MSDELDHALSTILRMKTMHQGMARAAGIEYAHVLCRHCGATRKVDGAHALRHGWPKCCGETMMLGAAARKSIDT